MLYFFGVLEYVVMIKNLSPKSTSFGARNEAGGEFLQRHYC